LHDVIVVGGGPAGSTAAALLARHGRSVLLVEKERFPRDHVGESLLPFCYGLFEDLGVRAEMDRRFVRKPGVRFIDRTGEAATTWCFAHVIPDERYLSYQVNRADFDQLLLNNTRRLGAEVREQTRASNFDLSDPELVRVETVDADGNEDVHTARFLIDATGRDAMVASKNGWRAPRPELDRTALWSHWERVTMGGGLEEGLSIIIYVGEEKKGWIWVFPLTPNRITAGVVMQNAYIREQRRKYQEQGNTDWKADFCLRELLVSPFVASLLEGAERVMPIMVNGDYSYEVRNHYGPNYAMIGDARGFIDPIFSSGVFLSMKTAYLVTDAIEQHLTNGLEHDHTALGEAYQLVTGAYDFVHRMIRLFYNPHAVTWAQVGADKQVHRAHESAMATGHFMLAGDFFENHQRYSEFFTLLEDPKMFQRYQRLVIDRSAFAATSCQVSTEQAFHPGSLVIEPNLQVKGTSAGSVRHR
jgi:flavin-dependent dehydrogenase